METAMEAPFVVRPRRHRNVARIDHRYFHGFSVAVKRNGETHRKCFRDGHYGSRGAALHAALQYRNELVARLPVSSVKRRHRRNTTGVVGVVLITQKRPAGGGGGGQYYVATWSAGAGRRKVRWFSVAKYGLDRARGLAIAARRSGAGDGRAYQVA
jgi:hypothetical protein